jgi:protein-L-isoaspartate(D-aspartate) O-methyltransferase
MCRWVWSKIGWRDERQRCRHDFAARAHAHAGTLKEQGIKDPVVLAAMNAVPRHPFLEESIQQRAYDDTPLPIGQGQTISSPYTVARSCELAFRGQTLERVLEIGGGCGYQAAVLSKLAKEVLSLERIAKLVGRARLTLRELRINNVLMKNVDGTWVSRRRRRSMPLSWLR